MCFLKLNDIKQKKCHVSGKRKKEKKRKIKDERNIRRQRHKERKNKLHNIKFLNKRNDLRGTK
jgi:hypothetical protein